MFSVTKSTFFTREPSKEHLKKVARSKSSSYTLSLTSSFDSTVSSSLNPRPFYRQHCWLHRQYCRFLCTKSHQVHLTTASKVGPFGYFIRRRREGGKKNRLVLRHTYKIHFPYKSKVNVKKKSFTFFPC